MANLFKKPSPGDPFKPNSALQVMLIDMLNWWLVRNEQPGIETLRGPDITIRNMESTGLDQFSVIKLGDIVLDPGDSERAFRNDLVFDADAPAADEIFLITQEPIAPDGGVGEARIAGFSRVKVTFSNADHKFAAPEDDQYDYLVSQASDGPAAIIWKEAGTGLKWAVVSLNVSSTPGFGATTPLCLQDCNGTEYCLTVPRAWLTPNDGGCGDEEDSPGGKGESCTECTDPLNQFCVVFPGVSDLYATEFYGCSALTIPVPITLGIQAVTLNPDNCIWGSAEIVITSSFAGQTKAYGVALYNSDAGWILSFSSGYDVVEVWYLFEGSWDCKSPLTLIRQGLAYGTHCQGFPDTVVVQPCGGTSGTGLPPTINFSSGEICDDAITMTITGTGFESTAANNLLTFSDGTTGICTAVTGTTSMTVSVALAGTGVVTCTIQNASGTSTAPVQVALVVTCGGTIWEDSFTGIDNTALTAHTGETTSGYTNIDGAMKIVSNKAVNGSADDDFGFLFDAGVASGTFTFKFKIPPASQDNAGRGMYAYFRYADSNNFWRVAIGFSAMADSTSAFQVQKSVSGSLSVPATGTVTINTDTEYICTIETGDTGIDVTINSVAVHVDDGVFYAYTKRGVAFHSTFSNTSRPYCDDVLVTN